jgi:3-hydroxyacyl-CoA dehydrogenase / enoyl-CoA hydratase / 3-hydroxybutyryl-CoA epimerase
MNTQISEKVGEGKSSVTVAVRPDGVAIVTIDNPGEALNTLTKKSGEDMLAAYDRVAKDPTITAAVLASGKKGSFVVGANIDMLSAITRAAEAEELSSTLAMGVRRLHDEKKPWVAAVDGPALGGGFELALACRAIVASDDNKTVFGLPEVQLGLLPAANGMLRIAQRASIQLALDLALTGKNTRPAKAKKLGLVDEVCPKEVLIDVAAKFALDLAAGRIKKKPTKLDAQTLTLIALEKNPAGRALLFKKARQATRAKTKGHYPATERIIDVLETFGSKGFDAAAKLEAASFGELVVSEEARELIGIFFATQALKKDKGTDAPNVEPKKVSEVAMLGGGLMGGGIAYVTIHAGISVRLKDKDDAGLGRGLKYVREILDERVKKKAMTPLERDQEFAKLTATTDYSGLKNADVVIEAVFEDLDLKHRVLRDAEANMRPDAIFASNTSSIPITKIAAASSRPENVVGMHYFSPVHKMPLLEVIQTKKTSPQVVATAVSLGKKQGKTCIVVNDGVGFYTSRILGPYMNEAAYLISEGVPADLIDRALVDWGFPIGPIALLDEVGIDVAAHVGPIMLAEFGARMTPPATTAKLIADDRKGRKNGRGFYVYGSSAKKGKKEIDASVYKTLGVEPINTKVPSEEIQQRCALQMVNEALHCLGERIVRSPRDADIGAIFGLGFPPFRGGPLRYVDSIGAAEVLRRIQGYEDRFGKRWTPAPILIEKARENGRFYDR